MKKERREIQRVIPFRTKITRGDPNATIYDYHLKFHTDNGFCIIVDIPFKTLAMVCPVAKERLKNMSKEYISDNVDAAVLQIQAAYTELYKTLGIGIDSIDIIKDAIEEDTFWI